MESSLYLLVRILGERLRSYRRLLAANAFVLFLLGPLILGGTWWVGDRYLEMARGPLRAHLAASASPGALGLGVALLAKKTTALPTCRPRMRALSRFRLR